MSRIVTNGGNMKRIMDSPWRFWKLKSIPLNSISCFVSEASVHFVFKREWMYFKKNRIGSPSENLYWWNGVLWYSFLLNMSYLYSLALLEAIRNNFREYFPLKELVYIMPCVFNCVLQFHWLERNCNDLSIFVHIIIMVWIFLQRNKDY